MNMKNEENQCFICDSPKRSNDAEGFGFIHKSIVIYDEEDIEEYQDKKGYLTFCNKCDDYFGNERSYEKYKNERSRIEAKLNTSSERFKKLIERLKDIRDLPIDEEVRKEDKLIRMIEEDHKIFISCVQWLSLPENHVKIKRFIR